MDNISRMAKKAAGHGLVFRPHFKTHQSRTIGRWFRDFGVNRIAVSSLTMARYFEDDGWNNISIAFPVNFRELPAISELNDRVELHILVSHGEGVEMIQRQMNRPVGLFIELDAGQGRSGFPVSDHTGIEKVIKETKKYNKLRISGFLIHSGQTYHAGSPEKILEIHTRVLHVLRAVRERFSNMLPEAIFSLGDTPSCSIAEEFEGVDEFRPGNFVFYDMMQKGIGACKTDQIAVCLACPVVARYPSRNEVIIYGGAIHLSKESLSLHGGKKLYGSVTNPGETGFGPVLPGCHVVSLSQEHGKIHAPAGQLRLFAPGSLAGILPVHSCLTADCMKSYLSLNGERIDHMQGNM